MKYKLLLLLLLVTGVCQGQERTYYCEIFCGVSVNSNEIEVYFDFGDKQLGKSRGHNSKLEAIDETGQPIKFKSRADVLNWMSDRGWTFVSQNYYVMDKYEYSDEILIVMSKVTTREKIKDGIILKGD